MNNHNRFHNKHLVSVQRFTIMLLLMAFFTMQSPSSARSQEVVSAPDVVAASVTNTVSSIAATVASKIAQIYEWMVSHADSAIQEALPSALKKIDLLQQSVSVQAGIDSRALESRKMTAMQHTLPYTMILPTGTIAGGAIPGQGTGTNFCNTLAGNDAMSSLAQTAETLEAALVFMTQHMKSGAQDRDLAEAADTKELIARGFISADEPAYRELASSMKAANVFDNNYTGRDLDPDAVVGPFFYDMPAKALVDRTVASRPVFRAPAQTDVGLTPADTTAALKTSSPSTEMDFIAALYYCKGKMPRSDTTATPLSQNQIAKANRDRIISAQSLNVLHVCVHEVYQRLRIGKTAATNLGKLAAAHYTQAYAACRSLRNEGKITADTYTDCQNNGMSLLQVRLYNACPEVGSEFALTKAGSGVHDVKSTEELIERQSDKCTAFHTSLEVAKGAFISKFGQ